MAHPGATPGSARVINSTVGGVTVPLVKNMATAPAAQQVRCRGNWFHGPVPGEEAEVLPRHTNMPFMLITDELVLSVNHVFIIPENRDLHIRDGVFHLRPISKPRGWPNVITIFLRPACLVADGLILLHQSVVRNFMVRKQQR